MDHLCYLCLVFVMLWCLFIDALWSPAGKGLTSWLLFVLFNCGFVTFPCGILGQVWYLIVSIPDLCHLSYSMANQGFNISSGRKPRLLSDCVDVQTDLNLYCTHMSTCTLCWNRLIHLLKVSKFIGNNLSIMSNIFHEQFDFPYRFKYWYYHI